MNVPGVVWVALILLLIPVVQQFIGDQWGNEYAITAAIIAALGAVAKWLQLYFAGRSSGAPEGAESAPMPAQGGGKVRRWLVG